MDLRAGGEMKRYFEGKSIKNFSSKYLFDAVITPF